MKSAFLSIILVLFLSSKSNSQSIEDYVPGKIIVKFKKEMDLSGSYSKTPNAIQKSSSSIPVSVENIFRQYEVNLITSLTAESQNQLRPTIQSQKSTTNSNLYLIEFDGKADPEKISKILSQEESIEYAEPDYLFHGLATSNDDEVAEQWYLNTVQAFGAWDMSTGEGQVIAILDTGVDPDHPDLQGKLLPGYDFVNDDHDPSDDNMHGTHVAGIAAASTDNNLGIAGVAPDAMILPIKVLQSSGIGSTSSIVQGIHYAVNNGATVINMSLGGSIESIALKEALSEAYASATIVASAGNNGFKMINEGDPPTIAIFPACYPFVIGVEATNEADKRASFSNYDPTGPIEFINEFGFNYELKAPGTNIISTIPGGNYRKLNGTSMSAPIVSGAVALLRSYDSGISNEEIFARLIQSSDDGILQIDEALNHVLFPSLNYQSFTLVDTLQSSPGDGDYLADAGELIGLSFSVKNSGGPASNVYVKLDLGEFEDPTVATIVKDSVNLGNIGIFGFLSHIENTLSFTIAPDVTHGRDITLTYEIRAENTSQLVTGEITIHVTNAEELSGILSEEMTLSSNKLWVINRSFKVAESGILNIDPGTSLTIEKGMINDGLINSIGTLDDLITIRGPEGIGGDGIITFENTLLEDFIGSDNSLFGGSKIIFSNCTVQNVSFPNYGGGLIPQGNDTVEVFQSTFRNIQTTDNSLGISLFGPRKLLKVENSTFDNLKNVAFHHPIGISPESAAVRNNNFSRIESDGSDSGSNFYINNRNGFFNKIYDPSQSSESDYLFQYNNFISGELSQIVAANDTEINFVDFEDFENYENNYWGTIDSLNIMEYVYDFWDDPSFALIDVSPFLKQPSSDAPGMVWKILINDVDPQDEQLDPIGAEKVKFEVFFNKPMDTLFAPFLTFGLREPRTQHVVNEDGAWNNDSTIWTGYHTVDLRTGDGLNALRVSDARDVEGREIPVEDNLRFKFNIQTVGSLSNNLAASEDIGKVSLEWETITSSDLLGYNVYRFNSFLENDELVFTDTLKINDALVLDSIFVDEGGDPDTDYYYTITSLDANFSESDFSSAVGASPLPGSVLSTEGNLDFDDIQINQSASLQITLSNEGNTDLTVSSISFPEGFSGDWESGTIEPQSSQTIQVTFAPTETINYDGELTINSDATTGENSINTTGKGTGSILSIEGNLDFEDLQINQSASLQITLSNNGNIDLTVSSISFPEGFSGDWDNGIINTESSQIVNVTFAPTETSNYSGDIVVNSDATTGESTVAVSGTGVGSILLLEGSLDFEDLQINETSSLELTLSNSGNIDLTVSSLSFPDGFSGDWDNGIINAESSQIVNVTFAPTETSDYSGDIVVNSDATTGESTVAVSGTGVGSILSLEGSLNFEDLEINETSSLELTLSNSGNIDLTVSFLSFPDGFSGDWDSGIINAESSQIVNVTFAPTETSDYSGDIVVNSDATTGESTVAVSGTGVGSILSLEGSLNFEDLQINETSSLGLTLSNSGNIDMTVSSLSFPDGFSGDWDSGIITAESSQIVNVTFAPTETSNYSGDIVVNSDATTGESTIAVSGTGVGSILTISEDDTASEVIIYPIPFSNDLNLELDQLEAGSNIRINLLDITGKVYFNRNFETSSVTTLDLSKLPAGVYNLILEREGKIFLSQKLIKEW